MTTEKLQVKLELNHKAAYREKPTPEGFTHDWMVTIRGPNGSEIEHFVEKVVFYLHDSFKKPKRSVKVPPYSIAESGYAGFTLPIDVCFRNKDEPKKITFEYDLFLHAQGCPPVNNTRCEKLTFENPTPDFRSKLLKAGAYLLDLTQKSPTNIPTGGQSPDLSVAVNNLDVSCAKSSSEVKKAVLKTEKSDVHKISTQSRKSSSHEMKKSLTTPNLDSKKTQELKKSPKSIPKIDPEFADLFGAEIKSSDIERNKDKSSKSRQHKDKKSSVNRPKSDKDCHSRDSSKLVKSTPDARKDIAKKHEKSSSNSRDNDRDQNASISKNKNRPITSSEGKCSKDGRSSKTEDRNVSKETSTHSDPGKDKKRDSLSIKPKGEKDRSNVTTKHSEEKKKHPKSKKTDRSSPPPDKRKSEKVKKDEKPKETSKEKFKERKHSDKSERSASRMSEKEKEKSERKEKREYKDEKKSPTVDEHRDKEKEKSRSRKSLVRSSSRDSETSKHSESKHESKSSHRSKSPDQREEKVEDEKRRREDRKDGKDSKHRKFEHKNDIPHKEKSSSSRDKDREGHSASVKSEKKESVKVREEKSARKIMPKKSPVEDTVVKKPVKIMEKLESLFSTGENSDDDPFENGSDKMHFSDKMNSSESDDQKSNASSLIKLNVKDKPLRKLMKQAHESDSDPESPLSPPPEDTKPFNVHSPLKREDTRGFSPRSEKKHSTNSEAKRKHESSKKRRSSVKSESPPKRARTPTVDDTPRDPRLKPRSDSVRLPSFGSDCQSDRGSKQSNSDMKQEPQVSDSSSSGSSDSENSDNDNEDTNIKVERDAVEFTEEYLIELVKIQQKLMASRDRDLVQKVVDLVGQTDCFDVDVAFNFDLCSLDKRTVHRIRDLLQCGP